MCCYFVPKSLRAYVCAQLDRLRCYCCPHAAATPHIAATRCASKLRHVAATVSPIAAIAMDEQCSLHIHAAAPVVLLLPM